jgi:hypothetical protein
MPVGAEKTPADTGGYVFADKIRAKACRIAAITGIECGDYLDNGACGNFGDNGN